MTETTTTPAPDAGGPPANTGVDLGGAFRTFADGSELPVADVSAAETPAEEAPVFAREDLATHDEAVGDADDADGEEDAALDEPTEGAETTETDGGEDAISEDEGEASDSADFTFPEVDGQEGFWNDSERAAAQPFLEDLLAEDLSPQERAAKVLSRY